MKPTRWESQVVATAVCALTALASPSQAQGWVTVNPDGSVTRTEVVAPDKIKQQSTPGVFPAAPGASKPSSQSTLGALSAGQSHNLNGFNNKSNGTTIINGTSKDHRRRRGGHRPQHHPAPGYYAYPAPAYPGYYGQYYSYPAPSYSGPIAPPNLPHERPAWITSIPLGGTYYGPAPTYPHYPAPSYPAYPAPSYPYYPAPGYGYYAPGTSTSTYGSVTLGGGGLNVTIGGRRNTHSSSSSTTIVTHR
jgi:hypothetical protein